MSTPLLHCASRLACIGFIALSVCAGCGPEQVEGDLPFVVLDWDETTESYALAERSIETMDDSTIARGSSANLRSGGQLSAPNSSPETEADFEDALRISGDGKLAVNYVVDDGKVVPLDFDTTVAFSLYHHLERARFFFEGYDLESAERVGSIPVYYRPVVSTGLFAIPLPVFTDNAAYAFTLDAFIIPPRLFFGDVPLAANRGVVVHEYSHAIFNRIVHANRRVPEYLFRDWPPVAANELTSLDEGLADFFGALQTSDPDFIRPSIGPSAELDRDLEVERRYTASMQDYVQRTSPDGYDPYRLGSVVASALWASRDLVDDQTLANAVLDSMRSIASPGPDFRLARFVDALMDNLDEDEEICAIWTDRLAAPACGFPQ